MHVVVVDDHQVVLEGLKQLLQSDPAVKQVTALSNAEELFVALRQGIRPDVCVLDLELPGMGGIEALTELRTGWPTLPVVVLSAQPARSVVVRCLRAGARGFISKGSGPGEFVDAVTKVAGGGRAVDADHLDVLLDAMDQPEDLDPHERLSDREFEVMRRLAAGASLQHIAQDLCISPKTVSTYRRRVLEKMNFERNAQLTEYALAHGLVPQSV